MEKQLICICCPKGCHLEVKGEDLTVTGNGCKRGAEYGVNEVTNPVRIVTSTVKATGGAFKVIPVKTKMAIPKGLIMKCMEEINKTEVNLPVKIGDVVIKNVLQTGVDVVVSKNVDKK